MADEPVVPDKGSDVRSPRPDEVPIVKEIDIDRLDYAAETDNVIILLQACLLSV